MQKALSDIDKYDVLVFMKLGRLTRSMKDLTYLVQLFSDKNKRLQAVLEAFDTTSISGRLMLNILGSFAKFERETMALSIKLCKLHFLSIHKYLGTPSNPSPYNGQVGVSLNPTFSFTCSYPPGDKIIYYVYRYIPHKYDSYK
ncbi:recombinase family protein [Athalassotoga sp.]|uniref:recombinase family protein n=1 Tax=Athalassotoga sp. TaxID=2022597 RepID=UPI003CFE1054